MNNYSQALQQLGERIRLHRLARGDSIAQMAERFHPAPEISQPINLLPAARLRDGGALPAYIRDALPDVWGRLVLSTSNQFQPLSELQMLSQTTHHRVGALVASEQRHFVCDEQAPLTSSQIAATKLHC